MKLLRTWEAAHAAARSRPAQAIAVMAAREGLSPQAFGQALEGLAFLSLQAQEPLFADGAVLDRNLTRLRAVQAQMGLMAARGPLPEVDGSLLRSALQAGPVSAP